VSLNGGYFAALARAINFGLKAPTVPHFQIKHNPIRTNVCLIVVTAYALGITGVPGVGKSNLNRDLWLLPYRHGKKKLPY